MDRLQKQEGEGDEGRPNGRMKEERAQERKEDSSNTHSLQLLLKCQFKTSAFF